MSQASIERLNKKIRTIGYDLARAEMRGMRGGNYFARKLAHGNLASRSVV